MHTRRVTTILYWALFLLLAGCANPVKQAAQLDPIEIKAGVDARPLQFKRVVVKLRRGEKIGDVSVGALCVRNSDLTWRGGRLTLSGDEFTEAFRDELQKANYVVVGNPDALFEDPSEWKAEYLVAGLVKSLQASVCYPLGGFGNFSKSRGGAFIKVDWQIYSRLERKVVYEVSTEGSFQSTETLDDQAAVILINAFASAVRNLLADKQFHALASGAPPVLASTAISSSVIKIAMAASRVTSIQDNMSAVRAGVATVMAGSGHGSGFFVGRDGHLLTNEHVVRSARFVKVRLATGRDVLGEVMRSDSKRDVALIKVEERDLPGLAISTREPNIGADVYAIGTPLRQELSTTVTRGIISAYRTEDGLRFIQSDVQILPGNSGGPLLDENGNVLGIAAKGYMVGRAAAPTGLNFFIPIREALQVLAIEQ
jgi:serine protease Do